MAEENKGIRLKKAATELNVGISTLVEFLAKKGHQVEMNPNTRLTSEQYDIVANAFQGERAVKEQADKIEITPSNSNVVVEAINDESKKEETDEVIIKNYNTSTTDTKAAAKPAETADTPDGQQNTDAEPVETPEPAAPMAPAEPESEPESEQHAESVETPEPVPAFVPTQVGDLRITGKIDLDSNNYEERKAIFNCHYKLLRHSVPDVAPEHEQLRHVGSIQGCQSRACKKGSRRSSKRGG